MDAFFILFYRTGKVNMVVTEALPCPLHTELKKTKTDKKKYKIIQLIQMIDVHFHHLLQKKDQSELLPIVHVSTDPQRFRILTLLAFRSRVEMTLFTLVLTCSSKAEN